MPNVLLEKKQARKETDESEALLNRVKERLEIAARWQGSDAQCPYCGTHMPYNPLTVVNRPERKYYCIPCRRNFTIPA